MTAEQAVTVPEWTVQKDGPVATVVFGTVEKPPQHTLDHHMSLAVALEAVRFDDSVRVVVITGREGGIFELGPRRGESNPYPAQALNPAGRPGGSGAIRGPWSFSQGLERAFTTLALMEKPVIGRLNGDAYAIAVHALWGSDVIVAIEDVLICDTHLAMHPTLPFGKTPGDGAFAFLSLFLTPTKLKELLLLGSTWTAKDLADLGVINYAVPSTALDGKVSEMIDAFLARPPLPLIRTKRAINKRLLEQLNLTMDYARLSQQCDLWELAATGFRQEMTLRAEEPPWTLSPTSTEQGLGE
jgi:enoyl-CoA hydratase/carnithine racemase